MKSLLGLSAITSGYAGHAHFGERALSRRRFLTTAAAGTLGLVLGSGLRLPAPAYADDDLPGVAPRPIPGGLTGEQFGIPGLTELFHVFPPAPGFELSTITDFKGFVGLANVGGQGAGGGEDEDGTFGFI